MAPFGFRLRSWCLGVAVLAVTLAGAYYAVARERAKGRSALATLNAAPLPAGTQLAWQTYVDRRLAATLRRGAAGISVRADIDGFVGNTTDIPFGSSFDVACPRMFGGIVHFRTGAETVTASIFGPTVVEPPAERPPPLGVSPRSVAALGLQQELCHQIAVSIQASLAR